MEQETYNLAFTAGALLHRESVRVAKLYIDVGDWTKVRDIVISDNLLQARTQSTLKRICSEVISRLKTLTRFDLTTVLESNPQDQSYLLWLAICRRYRFIAEFATEVLRERFITLMPDLNYEDFDSFFNRKADWHPELERISPSTKGKLRQVLFKMLREVDLLTASNTIKAAMLSPAILEVMNRESSTEVLYFPLFQSDLKGIAN